MELVLEKTCPICGKVFTVQNPNIWAFKRGSDHKLLCSWSCVRKYDKEKGERKVGRRIYTDEQREAVFQAAISGGSPIKKLEEFGSSNPSAAWYAMKRKMKEEEPERYAQLPDKFKPNAAAETPEGEYAPVPRRSPAETPEAPIGMKPTKPAINEKVVQIMEDLKITRPLGYEGFTVRAVEGNFGSYYFQDINGKQWLDYDDKENSNDLSMTIEQWRGFLAELRKAAMVLGVTL